MDTLSISSYASTSTVTTRTPYAVAVRKVCRILNPAEYRAKSIVLEFSGLPFSISKRIHQYQPLKDLFITLENAKRILGYFQCAVKNRYLDKCFRTNDADIPNTLSDDSDLMKLACYTQLHALMFASTRLRDDKDMVKIACMDDGNSSLRYASMRVRDDTKTMLWICSRNGCAFQYVSERCKDINEIVQAACESTYGYALKYASERCRDERQIIVVACADNGEAYQYASPRLRDDKDTLLSISADAYEFASARLRDDEDTLLAVWRRQRGLCVLQCASKRLRDLKRVIMEICRVEPDAIKFASPRLQRDKDVVEIVQVQQEKEAQEQEALQAYFAAYNGT